MNFLNRDCCIANLVPRNFTLARVKVLGTRLLHGFFTPKTGVAILSFHVQSTSPAHNYTS